MLADEAGRAILAGSPPTWWDRRIIIAEGEPDYLTLATRWGDAAETLPAVFGVISGSWTAEIAARIPDGAEVHIHAHADAAGHRYAEQIRSTLGRRCRLLRPAAPEARD